MAAFVFVVVSTLPFTVVVVVVTTAAGGGGGGDRRSRTGVEVQVRGRVRKFAVGPVRPPPPPTMTTRGGWGATSTFLLKSLSFVNMLRIDFWGVPDDPVHRRKDFFLGTRHGEKYGRPGVSHTKMTAKQ
jgi:hypothetical protein